MNTAVKTGIDLFPHNLKAYEAAVSVLDETEKPQSFILPEQVNPSSALSSPRIIRTK